MNEETNNEMAEAQAADEAPVQENVIAVSGPKNVIAGSRPKNVIARSRPKNVIARSPQATKQTAGITSGDEIAAPFGLAMTGEGKPSEKPDDAGKLAELETALNETRQSLAARTGDYDRLKAALDDTVNAYRKLAVSSSPLYSDDMISGNSVEEIDASIKKINGLVKKMRSSLEAELKDLTIPAGAPERSAPDLSGLSPREKIKYGIQEKK